MSVGNVRRIDSLGRVVIPIEIRRLLNLHDDTLVEMYIHGDSMILRRYVPTEKLRDALEVFHDKFKYESSDLKYQDAKAIEKRIREIRDILCGEG